MKTVDTFRMQLAPLPADRSGSPAEYGAQPIQGFVDEEVIASLISRPSAGATRVAPSNTDLVLCSDPDDFAGWAIPATSPFRAIAEKQDRGEPIPSVRSFLAAEPGLGEPHRGNHRWWIAAAATAASSLIISLLFAHLGSRSPSGPDMAQITRNSMEMVQSAIGALYP
jgi:hypothetical protein